ncbi:hypothetical protein FBR05_03450 [Deltaproteobacteria bacterium PRO3]|nr:hypothetical protein [Deltaproteobacteria bacterium PRO3]
MARKPAYVKLGLLVLILPALYATLTALIEWRPKTRRWTGIDFITQFERRLRPLKTALHGEEAVGYLGDHSDPSNGELQKNFQLTQYILAPAIVTDRRPTRYVVSVLPWTPLLEQEMRRQGLVLLKDFGEEVRLFKKEAP